VRGRPRRVALLTVGVVSPCLPGDGLAFRHSRHAPEPLLEEEWHDERSECDTRRPGPHRLSGRMEVASEREAHEEPHAAQDQQTPAPDQQNDRSEGRDDRDPGEDRGPATGEMIELGLGGKGVVVLRRLDGDEVLLRPVLHLRGQ
jgi:hypothetical protein